MLQTNNRKLESSLKGAFVSLLILALLIGASMMPASSVKAQQLSDKEITATVTDALMADAGVQGYKIDISTDDGIVTMSGTANNILAKKRAARIAETVKGVRGVINRVEIKNLNLPDEELRSDVVTALLTDPATDSWEIKVDAKKGLVTLTGTVSSWQEKKLAEQIAEGVRGVTEVVNKININYDKKRSDNDILAEIEGILDWDVLVDDAMVTVAVDNGNVELSGVVGSAAEKSRAELDAWVPGVTDVNDDNLKVVSWSREDRFRTDKYVEKPDQEIENAVKEAFLLDPRVNSFDVSVSSVKGVVTLDGNVDNLKAKRAATEDAKNIVGVWRVKNGMSVRSQAQMSDLEIKNKIRKALIRDPYINRYDINITVVDGVVYLSGAVDSYYEKAQADDVASRVNGVIAVENNISVNATGGALTYQPYVDYNWNAYDYNWYTYPDRTSTSMTDWEIKEEVEDALFWSPYVDSDDITVKVDDGDVELIGTVDTWYERSEATEKAYEGGATSVDNDLTVLYGPDYYSPK